MKRREYFLYAKKIKIMTIHLLSVPPRHRSAILEIMHQHTCFCYRLNTRTRILHVFTADTEDRMLVHNLQNGSYGDEEGQRGDELLKKVINDDLHFGVE